MCCEFFLPIHLFHAFTVSIKQTGFFCTLGQSNKDFIHHIWHFVSYWLNAKFTFCGGIWQVLYSKGKKKKKQKRFVVTIPGQGYYVYIEASSPRVLNDTARLASAQITTTTATCLHFWYHMYGTHVNTLNVYIKVWNTLGNHVWTHTGTL